MRCRRAGVRPAGSRRAYDCSPPAKIFRLPAGRRTYKITGASGVRVSPSIASAAIRTTSTSIFRWPIFRCCPMAPPEPAIRRASDSLTIAPARGSRHRAPRNRGPAECVFAACRKSPARSVSNPASRRRRFAILRLNSSAPARIANESANWTETSIRPLNPDPPEIRALNCYTSESACCCPALQAGISEALIRRQRLAPNAARILNSAVRPNALASARLARLTHARSSSRPATPINT